MTWRTLRHFDARYHPVLDEERDLTTSEVRYLRRTFDYAGRTTFQSYPSTSYGATAGINTVYDALGRMSSQQTTDGIPLATISYLPGNRRQMTDADGKLTTVSYQAFDTPEYSNPTQIAAPEGQTTTINQIKGARFGFLTDSRCFIENSTLAPLISPL